ncbi:MBL fold metallo-hydrolase [Mucilaginibacter sp. FT3.2]|uniref:MBL fold metallo-hydrolase n=1 Tax=Mucilaginibacter sp. FT3.2 TaxID=2723090 RepID=UPI001606FB83|nr:MBL fold metallo-hydrolase [Mucilaginibacter sp. FT3.2]MBB6232004.1 glyoxylase-like metal-dependent hydrolase (beta-lactamase superfamily II)/rhodanese-related sulfurtransferase [Mucilaginibacter sp. FT3.2]
MIIQQFYDKGLAHASYAIIRTGKMIVIDPARNPQPYYDLAAQHDANIVGVIETHPHADFISSHLEIHKATGAVIYCSKLTGATYPHETFDDGDIIQLNDIKLKAINTPGHSPDSICILLKDEEGKETAIFTGDTLFVGDVGRPDLRENVGNITAKKEELAKQMYQSTRHKLMTLPKSVVVYPAHGPGSLCGKNISPDLQSTIGRELLENYALQLMDELTFVKTLTTDQPFTPKYFEYDVELNKTGAPAFQQSVDEVTKIEANIQLVDGITIIDSRPKNMFRSGHLKGAINLQDGEKFETWLGSILQPTEQFYLIAENAATTKILIEKAAKIGYENNIAATLQSPSNATERLPDLYLEDFNANADNYTIIDVRNQGEVNEGKVFKTAISIPLPQLRERINEIPTEKPIVIHCAAGYRSAAATSIVAAQIKTVPVYDLGEVIKEYFVHE